jgi:hypothetical protein
MFVAHIIALAVAGGNWRLTGPVIYGARLPLFAYTGAQLELTSIAGLSPGSRPSSAPKSACHA